MEVDLVLERLRALDARMARLEARDRISVANFTLLVFLLLERVVF